MSGWEVCTEVSGRGFGQEGVNQNFDSQEASACSACSTWGTDLFSSSWQGVRGLPGTDSLREARGSLLPFLSAQL